MAGSALAIGGASGMHARSDATEEQGRAAKRARPSAQVAKSAPAKEPEEEEEEEEVVEGEGGSQVPP